MSIQKKNFAGQMSYDNGALMCTCCAVLWSISLVLDIITDWFHETHIDMLMKTSQNLYKKIKLHNPNSLLQQNEVFKMLNVSPDLCIEEYFASNKQILKDFQCECNAIVELQQFLFSMPHKSACILTLNQHAVAVFKHFERYVFFDSLPAHVVVCDDFAEFDHFFNQNYGPVLDCHLNFVYEK